MSRPIHYYSSVESTQDEARRLLMQSLSSVDGSFAVIAKEQTKGRGTQGRLWEGGTGNLFLTVVIPMSRFRALTLVPLQIAVLVAQRAQKLLNACPFKETKPKVTVKWPNDVLINGEKLSGTLIESETVKSQTFLLIGIGVNIAKAPNLMNSPGKQVRGSTSLQNYCSEELPEDTSKIFGTDLANALIDFSLSNDDTHVVENFKTLAEFGQEYEIRGEVIDEDAGGYQGERVVVLNVESDGQLRVRGSNGKERLLVAHYMF